VLQLHRLVEGGLRLRGAADRELHLAERGRGRRRAAAVGVAVVLVLLR
jgi:hypothetical protein